MQTLRQDKQFWLFGSKFAQKWILGLEFQKSKSEFGINILETLWAPIFRQNGQHWLFGSKFAKNRFWGRNFTNLSLDSESAPPIYHVCQFSVKMDNFRFFGLNLGKFPNYVQYFGSNIVEGVAESWVETEMSLVEVDGAEWSLKWVGWRWMELGGAGCAV